MVIDEAASHVSEDFSKSHAEIDWLGIISTRHILAHDYKHTRTDLVWKMSTVDAAELIELLQPLAVLSHQIAN